jgi:hypothetical protein
MYWKFSIQGAPVLSNTQSELSPLQISTHLKETIQTLDNLPPLVAHKTLEHYKEPFGLQKMQFRQLKEKGTPLLVSVVSDYPCQSNAFVLGIAATRYIDFFF